MQCYGTTYAAEPDKPVYELMLTYWCDQYVEMIHEMDMILANEQYNAQLQEEQNAAQGDFDGL